LKTKQKKRPSIGVDFQILLSLREKQVPKKKELDLLNMLVSLEGRIPCISQ